MANPRVLTTEDAQGVDALILMGKQVPGQVTAGLAPVAPAVAAANTAAAAALDRAGLAGILTAESQLTGKAAGTWRIGTQDVTWDGQQVTGRSAVLVSAQQFGATQYATLAALLIDPYRPGETARYADGDRFLFTPGLAPDGGLIVSGTDGTIWSRDRVDAQADMYADLPTATQARNGAPLLLRAITYLAAATVHLGLASAGTPTNQQQQLVTGLLGMGGGGFASGTRIVAREGAGVGTLVQGNNGSGVRVSDLTLVGASDTKTVLDLAWHGGTDANNPNVAPANLNLLRNIWVESNVSAANRAGSVAVDLSQYHDSPIDGLVVRGNAEIGLKMSSSGGYTSLSNYFGYGGRTQLACQNAEVSRCVITRGFEFIGGSWNAVVFNAVHHIDCDSYSVYSNCVGNGTQSLLYNGSYFNYLPSGPGIAHFQGRYWSGVTLRNCVVYDSLRLTGNITPAAANRYPVFRLENCKLVDGIPTNPSNCIYEFVNCVDEQNRVFSGRSDGQYVFSGDVQANNLVATSPGATAVIAETTGGSTPFFDLRSSGSTIGRWINTGGANRFVGDPYFFQGAWDHPVYFGGRAVWQDTLGRLRSKNGAPTSDTDGYVMLTNANGDSNNRPSSPSRGQQYFDTTLNRPIWAGANNGWVDASGASV